MSGKKKLESRISRGVRLFLFAFTIALAVPPSAFSDDAISSEGRLNRNAFQLSRFQDRFSSVPAPVTNGLRGKLDSVLSPIRIAPKSWFRKTFDTEPSVGDRSRLLESSKEVEIWSCLGNSCSSCPPGQNTGCVLSQRVSGGVGAVAVIHPCLYGEGPCPRNEKPSIDAWAERIVTMVPYYKLGLTRESASAMEKVLQRSSGWIQNTSKSVNRLLESCPGPYPSGTLEFLREVGSVSTPNPALKKCGNTYLRSVQTLARRCPVLEKSSGKEWRDFQKEYLKDAAEILRCDSFCRKMLCRGPRANAVFTKFGSSPKLLILDGGCEGETPTDETFIRDALPRGLRLAADRAGCLPAAASRSSEASDSGASGVGDGPEVQLVE